MSSAGLPLWSDYSGFVRRHRVLIAALMAVGLLAGLAWSWNRPTTYSATASAVLVPVPKYVTSSATALAPTEITIDTDAQLLLSPVVRSAVGAALGIDSVAAGDRMTITAAPRSHLLHVTITAGSPRAAADAADAAVAALERVRRASLGALRLDQLRQLRLLISSRQAAAAPTAVLPGYDPLSAQVLDLTSVLRELEEARRAPLAAIDPAVPPERADRANTEVPLTSGAMVGLLCGCLIGAGQDRRRRAADSSGHRAPLIHLSGGASDVITRHEDHHHVH